jgi:hypothetical protein
MNVCALAYDLRPGGNDKAREALHEFWRGIHLAAKRIML